MPVVNVEVPDVEVAVAEDEVAVAEVVESVAEVVVIVTEDDVWDADVVVADVNGFAQRSGHSNYNVAGCEGDGVGGNAVNHAGDVYTGCNWQSVDLIDFTVPAGDAFFRQDLVSPVTTRVGLTIHPDLRAKELSIIRKHKTDQKGEVFHQGVPFAASGVTVV